MKILYPFRPDIYGERVEEFSAAAMAVNLGNHLIEHGHNMGFVTSMSDQRFGPSVVYHVPPTMKEMHAMAESFMIYREYGYDILHTHTANFSTFKQLLRYMRNDDRVVCTIHIPANIGMSFWHHRLDLKELLKFPNFRLVCVSKSGSFDPLADVFEKDPSISQEDWNRVRVIHNGVIDLSRHFLDTNAKLDRFMFVAHMMPSKNVKQTLHMAVEHDMPCLYVGRRLAHKKLSPTEEAYAADCEALINRNSRIITHVPYLPYHECVQEMARSRCLIILSELESFGFTPVEAAMVGTPTIWTACQGIDETMQDGLTGYRIDRVLYKTWAKRRARAAELYHAVNKLDARAMGVHAFQRFSIGACTRRYEDLYFELQRESRSVAA